ncbi:hypothetical protein ASPVEDRAFT_224565 [Aspergillus versicolor CBS 583.65]|uniref:FAD/NAD(P)-binding domain-containing protein n=1 Tax=Aspergillus versicolor CBS 583.65 TaxID=1036611 RepID=A0A1L9P3V4_ASPVE|nr:uncharacterized protein ASPVEDRAFT_224565 [Aspergillus versicolor CBS 583.65]OJI96217.1 hypothetical protein ASPVEDRAFT_224565 [Aspergillus versicolor CBS 583.65]
MAISSTICPHDNATTNLPCKDCIPEASIDIEKKYDSEREIQLRSRDVMGNVEIDINEGFETFAQDPWIRSVAPPTASAARLIKDAHHKVLIIGAGHAGLLFAVRLIETGAVGATDIVLVDKAAGFGGTWYWNRYPGIMCDTESYIYMPLLEETGYMPRDKYASGDEIRSHTERIAGKWGLAERALFRTTVQELLWDEGNRLWRVSATTVRGGSENDQTNVRLTADFAIIAQGVFASPKIPAFPGISEYSGKLFHTARWDYDFTGGTPQNPELARLRDKKVAIIGTGASAVQIVPHLAKYCKELHVFQRTPSSIDKRGNGRTDPLWWKDKIQSEPQGWQRRRMENFNAFTCNEQPPPPVDMVADGWTKMPSFSLVIGSQQSLNPDYVEQMQGVDQVRQQEIRARVNDTVKDSTSAGLLAPWYPGWCKRPCFHDDYLSSFNQMNVKLVDIRGKGISRFTPSGIVANNTHYEYDAVIFSTGFSVITTRASPGSRANISVIGRHGQTMDDKWANGLATLHGVMTRDLPNLFFPGMSQAGTCANQTYSLDQSAIHVAYILAKAIEGVEGAKAKVVIEPTGKAEEDWAMQVVSRAAALRGLAGCTPGYFNGDGMLAQPKSVEALKKAARMAMWGEGIASYVRQIETWRAEGGLKGLDLT